MIYIPVKACNMSSGTFVFSVEEGKIHSPFKNAYAFRVETYS